MIVNEGLDMVIEPKSGATYGPSFEGEVGVYSYDTWPERSVLAGRQRRTFHDCGTLEEMKAKYPTATVAFSSGYVEDSMLDLSDSEDGDDVDYDHGDI